MVAFAGYIIDIVDQLAVEPAGDVFAGHGHLDVVPAVGLDVPGFGVHGPFHFNGVLGIVPAAQIPPTAQVVVVHAKQDLEPFRAIELARLERDRIVGPGVISDQGTDKTLFRGLSDHAVLHGPIAIAQQFPAFHAVTQIGFEQHGPVRGGDQKVLVFRCRVPGAQADLSAAVGRHGHGRLHFSGQIAVALI